jgi:arylsulfatase
MSRPNVLWICTDQQRFDTLGCYGNPFLRTPNLDRLARGGTIFTRAFSQSPVCTPSRGCFLTGRYPRTCRARQNGVDIPADEVLVTRILSEAGYVCGLSGKLHLSACNPNVCKGTERRIEDGYDQFFWSHDTGDQWPTNEYHQWVRDKGGVRGEKDSPLSHYIQKGWPEHLHQTTWCVEKAVSFIRSAERFKSAGRTWLFCINTFDPHHPFDPPEEYLRHYLDQLDKIPLPNYMEGELEDKPVYQKTDHRGAYGMRAGMPYDEMTERDHRLVKAAYWAMCELIDAQLGRLIETLEQTGQMEDTLIIFTSDHGEMLGDHGIYLKGPYFYEPAIRVPLIFSWPGKVRAQRLDALVELTDLPQTLLDAAGLSHHPGMQGKSLWPLLTGEGAGDFHREDVYCEYYNAMPWHREPTAQMTMVRTDRYKITVDHSHSTGELYDLEAGPGENRNLWNDPEYTGVKIEMLVRLANRMAFTADPLPPRRAAW